MGCGFSREEEGGGNNSSGSLSGKGNKRANKKSGRARPKESGLNGSGGGEDENNWQSNNGGLSGDDSDLGLPDGSLLGNGTGGDDDEDTRHAKPKLFDKFSPSEGTIQTYTEISSSQVDFFKMLDEKIENGVALDEEEEESDRLRRMHKNSADFEQVLSDDKEHEGTGGGGGIRNASQDSLKTVYSNSTSLPFSTLSEAPPTEQPTTADTNATAATESTTASSTSSMTSNNNNNGSSSNGRPTPAASFSPPLVHSNSSNQSIQLSNVLKDSTVGGGEVVGDLEMDNNHDDEAKVEDVGQRIKLKVGAD